MDLPTSGQHSLKVILTVFCLIFIFAADTSSAHRRKGKKVLVLHSYHVGLTWTDNVQKGILDVLGAREDVELSIEYMDTKRNPRGMIYSFLASFFAEKYKHHHFDAILTSDDNAFDFAMGVREVLFPGVPIIFCGINNYDGDRLRGFKNTTGVIEDVDFMGITNLILDLFPKTETIAVISDSTLTSNLHKDKHEKDVISKFSHRIKYLRLYGLSASDLTEKLKKLPPNTAVIDLGYFVDSKGELFNLRESNLFITEASPAPVFTAWSYSASYGIIGGLTTSGYQQGKIASELVEKVLDKVKVSEIKIVEESPKMLIFDYPAMRRFDIDKKDLPPTSIVLNEPESFYYKYKTIVWITSAFLILQTLAIFLLLSNIKQRELAQKSLADSEKRFRNLIEFSPLPVMLFDLDGNITYTNHRFAEIFGYTRNDIKTTDGWWRLAYPDPVYRQDTQKLWGELLDKTSVKTHGGGPFERRVVCKNGEVRHIDFFYRSLGVLNIVILNDLTEKYANIEERKKIERQLMQAQKMESIGKLAGGIAHDFNNILAAIMGFTDLALEHALKGSQQKRYLVEISRASNRAKELVKQILAFARQSDEEIRPVRLCDIITETLKLLRPSTPATIEFTTAIETKAFILGNPSQLHQVFLNLCTNAIHATQEHGGKIEIGLTEGVGDASGKPNPGHKAGRSIQLTVSDNGSGIEAGIIERIFEPYFTTKGVGDGTGMGLAMVKGIVESYGGTISVTSIPRKKTSFIVRFPTTSREDNNRSPQIESIELGTEHILFVDDEPSITYMGSQMLESLGYTVTTETNSLKALERFKEQPEAFDLVITDMTMPMMTGDTLSMELRKIRPDIPIILCTGYSKKMNDERAKQIGANAFVIKPFKKLDFSKTIRRILDSPGLEKPV